MSTSLAPSAYVQRRAEPHPRPGAVMAPVRLEIGLLPTALDYVFSSYWEERPAGGATQRTGIEKCFRLNTVPHPTGLVLDYTVTAPPVLRKPDLSALERAVLLLADLYQHLELRLGANGQVLAVLNHPEVQQTWKRVQAELLNRAGGADAVTAQLLAGVAEQLAQPAGLLTSLRYDYLFAFLLKDIYQQRFEGELRYGQAQVLPRFFADADLWYWERLALMPAPAPGRVGLHLSGELDRARTDVLAVVQHLRDAHEALTGVPAAASAHPADLRLAYEATYEVDAATGWPVRVEASVRCWLPNLYSKEYFLRFELAT